MPKGHRTREEQRAASSAVEALRAENAARAALIVAARSTTLSAAAFDELMALVKDMGPTNVLTWAKAGQEKSGSVVRLTAAVE